MPINQPGIPIEDWAKDMKFTKALICREMKNEFTVKYYLESTRVDTGAWKTER